MYEIAKKQNIPWHLPNKVDFITLDPRGSYGGAMYPKESENEEFNFEQVFANLVCDFGGHSSEKKFYQIDGSWGITADMEMATEMAKTAVQSMGLGPKTGKISISETPLGTIDVSPRVRNNIDKDIELLLKNANIVSDKIVCGYNTFIQEFTEKYKSKVGTGDCIIPSDVFQEEINEWKSRQSKEKLKELELLESKVIDIMGKTKKGELVNIDD
jgi:ATP-dependent Zn protease